MTDTASSILTQGQQQDSQGGSASAGGASNSPWYGEVLSKETDTDFKAYVQNKNYPSPLEALKGHYNAEKLIGLDRAGRTVALPKDDNDTEGWKAFRSKLGVPESPDGYKLPFGEDAKDLSAAAAKWFHEAGIPPKAAEKFSTSLDKFVREQMQAEEQAEQAKHTQELNALKLELGNGFEAQQELSRRAMRVFGKDAGFTAEDIDAMESAIGLAKTVKLFMKMGDVLREADFAGGGGQGFGATPDSLREKIKEIQTNRTAGKYSESEWQRTYLPEVLKLQEALDKL